jgi:hypothetical protein
MQRVQRDGWWTHEGGGYDNHENPYSVSLSIGYRLGHARISYRDLGRYSQSVAFGPDDENYDASSPTGCVGDCPPTTWGYNYQEAQIIDATYRVTRGGASLIYGAGLKRTRWQHLRHNSSDGDYSKKFSDSIDQTEYGISTIIGAAYSFGEFDMIAQWIKDAYRFRQEGYLCCPPSKDVWQIGIER